MSSSADDSKDVDDILRELKSLNVPKAALMGPDLRGTALIRLSACAPTRRRHGKLAWRAQSRVHAASLAGEAGSPPSLAGRTQRAPSHVPIRPFHEAPQRGCTTCDASPPNPYLTILLHKLCCSLGPAG